jgi:hypothetical protein
MRHRTANESQLPHQGQRNIGYVFALASKISIVLFAWNTLADTVPGNRLRPLKS